MFRTRRSLSGLYLFLRGTVLSISTVVIMYPMLWMIAGSLKSNEAIRQDMFGLIPIGGPEWSNYAFAWNIAGIWRNGLNSLYVSIIAICFIVFLAYLTSYALARINFPGRNLLLTVFVTLMLVPLGQVTMIPQFRLIAGWGLHNNLWSVILLYINGGIPISVFLLTSFMKTIPKELDESAYIDGAGRLRIIFQIFFPLTLPGLATVVIFQFMMIWNDYFIPLIYLQRPEVRTVTLGLANFNHLFGQVDYNMLFAALCIVSLPIIAVYLIFQRLFISGITAGAVKM